MQDNQNKLPESLDVPHKNKLRVRKGAGKKWIPKTWKPEYEQIVVMFYSGRSRSYLSEIFGVSKQQITNIVHTPQGDAIKEQLFKNIREHQQKEIPARLDRAIDGAVTAIEEVFVKRRDDLINRAPLAMVDKSMKLLTGVGHLKSGNETNVNTNVTLSATIQNQLVQAMNFANRVKEKHNDSADAA